MKNSLLDHQLGSPSPTVSILEYGDFECPYCGKFDQVIQKILKKFPDDVAYSFRHFPMVNIHPDAGLAAIAAEAAGLQNKYWQMHHMLFSYQESLSGSQIMRLAHKLKLDEERFQADLESEVLWNKIQRHIQTGIESKVTGTPSLYLNNEYFNGASSYDSLKNEIEDRISNASSKFI